MVDTTDLMAMKVIELKDELEARGRARASRATSRGCAGGCMRPLCENIPRDAPPLRTRREKKGPIFWRACGANVYVFTGISFS